MSLVSKMDERFYPDFPHNWDNDLFRQELLSVMNPDMSVLDLGAGVGGLEQMNFKGHVREIHGADVDPVVKDNPNLDQAFLLENDDLQPVESARYDLVFSCNVLEHIEKPDAFLAGVKRVLKPGGLFMFKTPNKFHYVAIAASLTPHSFHEWINEKRGRASEHTFPTYYRMNSRGDLNSLASDADMKVDELKMIEGRPEYLRFNAATYACGLVYERTINALGVDFAKVIIVGKFKA